MPCSAIPRGRGYCNGYTVGVTANGPARYCLHGAAGQAPLGAAAHAALPAASIVPVLAA